MRRILLSLSVLLTLSLSANAQTVSVPNTLTNGSVADADAMNENFEAVRTGVNPTFPRVLRPGPMAYT